MSDDSRREVTIFMTPIKELGRFRRLWVRALSFSLGSSITVAWCMHWVIRIENRCFELERFSTPPYTRLRASQWDGSREAHMLQQMHVGYTVRTDQQVEELSAKYFDERVKISYDIYMNNCQTFVSHAARTLCSDTFPSDQYISIPLQHILSLTVARAYVVLSVPLLRMYFRLRGCNVRVLSEFEEVSQAWGYWILPMILHVPLAVIPEAIARLEQMLVSEEINSVTMRYLSAIMASVPIFGMPLSQALSSIWFTQPWLRKHPHDKKWRLRDRPNHYINVNAGGVGSLREMGTEHELESLAEDPDIMVTDTGRWKNPDSVKVPEWIWIVVVIAGLALGSWFWSIHFLVQIIKWPWQYTKNKEPKGKKRHEGREANDLFSPLLITRRKMFH